jgi:NADH-quinone oxidoreductase subunit F
LIVIEPGNLLYCHVSPDDVHDVVSKTILNNEIIERLLYRDPVTGKLIKTESEVPFYSAQDRQILSQNRLIDPCSLKDYIAIGGYTALGKTLFEIPPESVIQEIKKSGLRGRGGGGFPTGRKWAECRQAPGDEKYVICNADEGDPGAYMDRCVLEGNPHLVLEGMMIGAWAIGAGHGYVYVRNEYPLAVEHIRMAIRQARDFGLLGNNILGSSFSFDVEVARGGGAFVCGESTALMASLEGKVGEPRPKDVHTVIDGLWHKPTTLNNVETWANVPAIMQYGSSKFAAKGSKGSKGTKILALTGCIKNTGLVEVEMGTPIKTIVFDIGGGAANGKPVKAVQTGGPSGGCLPVDKFNLPVDFDALYDAGSMIGSGGMVVMDEATCMVDVAKYFLSFLQDESCGKCVPCRLGVDRMLEIVTDITEGRGTFEQINLLEELGDTISLTALCGLGKTAANPVLSTLRYFREEYETHIKDKKCPAGVCQALITYAIDPEKCTCCGICKRACPHGAITGKKKKVHAINLDLCQKCGICRSECKFEAIIVN